MSQPELIITEADLVTLKSIENAFSHNLLASQPDAEKIFKKTVSPGEMFSLVAGYANFAAQNRNPNITPEKKAKALTGYCDKAVPPLQRAFGEAAMLKALPEVAREQRTIDVCRALGAKNLAALCEKAKNTPKA